MALFSEDDADLLKKWIVSRLEDISDADSDVLADYVLALLRHEQTEDEVKQMCVDQLEDFLREHTPQFVNDVFHALRHKTYLSVNSTLTGGSYVTDSPAPPSPMTVEAASPSFSHTTSESAFSNPRKRTHGYIDRDAPGGEREYATPRGRGAKAPRRGGPARGDANGRWTRGGGDLSSGGRGGRFTQSPPASNTFPSMPMSMLPGMQMQVPPMPMPGMPWGDDPMSQFIAAQAAAAAAMVTGNWPGMPMPQNGQQSAQLTKGSSGANGKRPVAKINQRCKDYDDKGYCMRGDMCPYEHGNDRFVVPGESSQVDEEYDPNNSILAPQMVSIVSQSRHGSVDRGNQNQSGGHHSGQNQSHQGGRGGRGRGNSSNRGNRPNRSEYSSYGPNTDGRNATLVVESIPDDKLDDASVREFFNQFGEIENVDVKPLKHLAIIKFADPEGAKKAHTSPAPIFDNRFVKVFWHKSDNEGTKGGYDRQHRAHAEPRHDTGADAMDIDMDEFNRKQDEAQKLHDEKMAKKKAIEEAAKELEKRKEELNQKQAEQKKLLLEKLAKKHAAAATANGVSGDTTNGNNPPTKEAAEAQKTAALRAQLEVLEAEAASLGIDHSKLEQPLQDQDAFGYRGRGRGGYRARGAFVPRGRGEFVPRGRGAAYPGYAPYPTYRGGGGRGAPRGGGAMRLDNRPRKITIAGVSSDKDEGLRQHLLHIGEFESIEPSPDKENAQIVTFRDRRNAEKFFYSGGDIPNVGKVELSWYITPSSIASTKPSTMGSGATPAFTPASLDVDMAGVSEAGASHNGGMEEYDIADDDEGRWG